MTFDPKNSRLTLADGAFYSRKFLLTLLGLGLITIVGLVGLGSANIMGIFPTFIGGVLGVLSLYFTGNVVTKHVMGKHLQQPTPPQPPVPPSEEEEEVEGK